MAEDGKLELKGNILDIGEESVICEFYTNNDLKQVRFPKNILPADIHYGMSISLIVDENGDIVFREREADSEKVTEGKAEMELLMNDF